MPETMSRSISNGQLLMLTADERHQYIATLSTSVRHKLAELCLLGASRELNEATKRQQRGRLVHARLMTGRSQQHAALAAQLLDY